MPRRDALIILGVLLALCTVALSIATNVATGALPEDWQPTPMLAWSAVIGLTVLTVVFTAWQLVVAERPGTEAPVPAVTDRDAYNRRRMIEKVRADWIDGYLRRSLHDLARIELGLEEKADAVNHAWSLVVLSPAVPVAGCRQAHRRRPLSTSWARPCSYSAVRAPARRRFCWSSQTSS